MRCFTAEKSASYPSLQSYRTGCRICCSRQKDIFCPLLPRTKTEVKLEDGVDVGKKDHIVEECFCESHFIRGST